MVLKFWGEIIDIDIDRDVVVNRDMVKNYKKYIYFNNNGNFLGKEG